MGVLSRFREHAQRVGAELVPALGGTVEPPEESKVSWTVRGQRGGRDVLVELNELHGIYGLACSMKKIGLRRIRIADHRSMFAKSDPHITEALTIGTLHDGEALWNLVPAPTREAIETMLAPESSSLTLRKNELSVLLGPIGLLRSDDAAATILASLDALCAIAPVLEEHWDVDPYALGS